MKKTSLILVMVLLSVLLIGLTGCGTNNDYVPQKSAYTPKPSIKPSTEYVPEKKEDMTPSTPSKPQINYNYPKEEQKIYSTTVAVSGAIIVEDDHESTVVYSRKCDRCGYVESDRRVTNPGGIISSFFCQKCGENSKLELRTTYSN